MTDDRRRVLVACDKFKGSLTAREVIQYIGAGLRDVVPHLDVRSVIVADGGDGTLEAALAARDAALDRGELIRRARPRVVSATQVAVTRVRTDISASPRSAFEMENLSPPVDVASADSMPASTTFDLTEGEASPATSPLGPRTVPEVEGLPLRVAVRRLHAAGFLVRIVPGSAGTVPVAGTIAPAGAVVRLGDPR